MNITQENYNKKQDNINLVKVHEALYKIIEDLHQQEHINVNYKKKKQEQE